MHYFKILLAIHITIVIVKNTFLKLKLFKSYTKSPISKNKLIKFVILYLKSKMLKMLNYKILINNFIVDEKIRKKNESFELEFKYKILFYTLSHNF